MSEVRDLQADALIGEIRRESAGRLTIFLGAAPGVGKTYAMLSRAIELQRQGLDVAVGIVETHGRSETAALLAGLQVMARKRMSYQGRVLEEMDLDAVLARHPQLALVDELAHRNVPGSRHERRWQDVIELLDAGIDVYTTINIQHLESLNDVVYQITGIRVSETVPDLIFDRLRDIRLVDLAPRELIERLNQGKVYMPEQAAQALEAFFSPSNLAALRELAMQTAADRVDSDLRDSQTARGLPGLALGRRVLVAIDGLGQSEYLVRMGRRIAERRAAPWTVVTVHMNGKIDESRQIELDKAFSLARKLGADTETLHGTSIVDALLGYAERSGVSAIVIGRTRERPWARAFNRTLTQQILRHGAHYELTIVNTPHARVKARYAWNHAASSSLSPGDLLLMILATLMAVGLAWLAEHWVGLDDLSMVFIVAVVLVASRTRMLAAVITAVFCFLAYNYFFIEPRAQFHINAQQGVITVFLFLVAALVAGRLAATLRAQVLALRAANVHAVVLQSLGRQLASAADLGQVARAGEDAFKAALGAHAWIRIGDAAMGPAGITGPALAEIDLRAADWAQKHGEPTGRFTDTLAGAGWWFLPVRNDAAALGVVGLHFPAETRQLVFERRRLAEAMVDDIGQAALRTQLVADLQAAKVNSETERLRSALLSSVSHDLRSPLAAMIGAASSLSSYAQAMSGEDRSSLLETIMQEGERLDRYIQNLLDMTRLGHEGLALHRDWIGVDELIGSAARRLRRYQPQICLNIDLPADLPDIWVHPALVEQAIFNVLENAAKFSPEGECIEVGADVHDGQLRIDVGDQGPGIPEAERERIFDMFYSVERGDRGRTGTGLGLTICQGMIGAHGGQVQAFAGRHGRGTTIRISLPLSEPPSQGHDDDND